MISRLVRLLVVLVVAPFTGCGGEDGTGPGSSDSTTPGLGWETLQGTYAGDIASMSQGVTYAADLSVIFHQSGGEVSGSYAIIGILSAGTEVAEVKGTGSFTGTLDRGEDPSVNITFVNQCPGYSARFSGALETATNLLTISGPSHILVNCVIFLTFESTILMRRIVPLEDEPDASPMP